VERIQRAAEARAPRQLKNRFPGYEVEKQHLDQPDQEIDFLMGQHNLAIFPTNLASSTIEGGGLRLLRTMSGYPYLLWGQCALEKEIEQANEVYERFELITVSEASVVTMHNSVTVDGSESVEHGAPEKGEPEKYPSTVARARWEDDSDDNEENESRWVRMARSYPRQESRFKSQDNVPSANRWGSQKVS